MKKYFVFILCVSLLFGNFTARAQQPADTAVHYAVDRKPDFPGHHEAYLQFVATLLHYPKEAKEKGISGKVFISFVVERDGSLSHLKILKGIGYGCDTEVLRVFRLMPKWNPGLVKGRPVRAYAARMVSFLMKKPAVPDNNIYTHVDSLPVFAVGKEGVEHFLLSHLWYPKRTVKHDKTDTVKVSFVVEKDRTITNLKLMPEKQNKDAYDYEALRVVSLLPVAHPAILNGKPVRERLYVPVVFDHKNVVLKGGHYKTVGYNFMEYKYFVPKGHLPVIYVPGEDITERVYTHEKLDKMPQFPGGLLHLMRYLSEHIKYPAAAMDNGCSGTVVLHFVVETDGSISNIKVLMGVCPSLDNEAIKVVSGMPKWIPGHIKGKPVRVSFNLPVKFSME